MGKTSSRPSSMQQYQIFQELERRVRKLPDGLVDAVAYRRREAFGALQAARNVSKATGDDTLARINALDLRLGTLEALLQRHLANHPPVQQMPMI